MTEADRLEPDRWGVGTRAAQASGGTGGRLQNGWCSAFCWSPMLTPILILVLPHALPPPSCTCTRSQSDESKHLS